MKWINWLISPLSSLYRLWYRFYYRKLSVIFVDDIQDNLRPGSLCLVGDEDDYWAVSMRCPCGCGDMITLNLIGPHPVWKVKEGNSGRLNLYPSVYRLTGCRSHYWIRDGRVIWVKD